MRKMNIYPFTRTIVLEQKSQQQQDALLSGVNKDVDFWDTPADYSPIIYTNEPIEGVTDQLSSMKPTISVVEEYFEPVTPTVQKEVKMVKKPQPLIGTIIATAVVVTAGFFLYKRLFKSK